jgi:exo-1,4-beta-D-glucosaminidase
VAREGLRAQIRALRSHPSVMLWANGSDGLPPDPLLSDYHQILQGLHWANATVDTVSHRNARWDGIHMAGPYIWRPPYYWFSEKFGAARGSSAEEGDNEVIPPLESLQKFLPSDKLWPANDHWFFHSGANDGNNKLENIQKAIENRYGPSGGIAEFTRKAQLAHYEGVRAQFENYAASGWTNHKMMIYWMLNNHWPSFFGHLFDYYFKQGGGYFGAKKALRPVSVVYDYYATGDRSKANIYVVNQTLTQQRDLKVSVSFYNIDGTRKYDRTVEAIEVGPLSSKVALVLPRISGLTSTYFIRCQLHDVDANLVAENVYWQSTHDDDFGSPSNDQQFSLAQNQWADFSALGQMASVDVGVSAERISSQETDRIRIVITNSSDHIAFFSRIEVTKGVGGLEVLPIIYQDNYITIFPHESNAIEGSFRTVDLDGLEPALLVEGWNVKARVAALTNRNSGTPGQELPALMHSGQEQK